MNVGLNISEWPSIVRLNSPDKIKYGGGHRVKQLTINDGWDVINNSNYENYDYGQTYEYRLSDGTSSGVAEYEPLVWRRREPISKTGKI